MLRITIQMISANGPDRDRVLGVMDICNDGTHAQSGDINSLRGNYNGVVYRKGHSKLPHWLRKGRVDDYPRMSYNVWRLVLRMLRSCFPEER